MNADGGGQVWRYEASLGLVGVPTPDGRVLQPPKRGEGRQWLVRERLPVMAFQRVSSVRDVYGVADFGAAVGVASIDMVQLRAGELLATGTFADTVLGEQYAGALAVDAVWLGLDVDQVCMEPIYRAVLLTTWRIRGAMMVDVPPWPRDRLSLPRVWRAPAGEL